MATVFFGHFGAKNHPSSHFDGREQQLLIQAVADATESLSQALIAANKNFKGHHDKIQLWFGEVTPEMFVDLKKIVYRMHSIIIAPETFIKFIDARGQYACAKMARMPLNNIADARYDELIMQGGERKKIHVGKGGFIYSISWPNFDGLCNAHVGSVMNIYIADSYFNDTTTRKFREKILLHECSHKILFTTDYAVSIPDPNKDKESTFIYGEKNGQWLATINSLEAMRNADCWAFFLCSFTEEEVKAEVNAEVEAKVETRAETRVDARIKRKKKKQCVTCLLL